MEKLKFLNWMLNTVHSIHYADVRSMDNALYKIKETNDEDTKNKRCSKTPNKKEKI